MEKPPPADTARQAPALTPVLAARLAALDQQFRAGLRQRLQDICADEPELAYAALHRLVGAAGMYGHDKLGMQARRAMNALSAGQPAAHAAAMASLVEESKRLLDA